MNKLKKQRRCLGINIYLEANNGNIRANKARRTFQYRQCISSTQQKEATVKKNNMRLDLVLQNFIITGILSNILMESGTFPVDSRIVTDVRNGLERSLDFIDKNVYKVGVDCLLGVAFVSAFVKDIYHNGAHIMDNSSLKILKKSNDIIEKRRFLNLYDADSWKFRYLVDEDVWSKNIKYRNNSLFPFWKIPNPHFLEDIQESQHFFQPSTDECLGEIINATRTTNPNLKWCRLSKKCWNRYFRDKKGHGYLLTHKLLLLQVAKAKKCIVDSDKYENEVKKMCSVLMSEVFSADYYKNIEDIFDLFLEEVLLCGYEGFTEFLRTNWLYTILKSQRIEGCFKDILTDEFKTRIKKNMINLEGGCNDHSTGLGAAVLALYYNFIVKEGFT